MDISTLDEYQGIEAQMVRDWMTRKGCYRQDGYWRHPRDKYSYTDGEYGGLLWEDTLFKLSVDFGFGSVQALLREINPRMRKGWPSGETLSLHDRWIVSKPDGTVVMCRWRPPYLVNAAGGGDFALPEQCKQWSFWPCDEHGNKTRWPTDAEGNML